MVYLFPFFVFSVSLVNHKIKEYFFKKKKLFVNFFLLSIKASRDVTIVAHVHRKLYRRGLDGENRRHSFKFHRVIT
jgi:hypothetical protein